MVLSCSYYTRNGQPLDRVTRTLVEARVEDGVKDVGGLADTVPLAKGMKVMVTYNIETELDVANGVLGIVERIILHDGAIDSTTSDRNTLVLTRPPAYVLVRLSRTKAGPLAGLEAGIVPIVPMRARMMVDLGKGKRVTVWREQLPLTSAYAFTDYRSQGQTIPYVIVDLATPPSGGLTPFNAYVALGRSRDRQPIRFLREFDPKIFTSPPDERLLAADRELARLDEETRREMETRHVRLQTANNNTSR
ncbi:hypothetical protein FRC10_010704 [Ceratobasidium sp. 414]|nr:hypothetical protein FRC10_010704 [Ceratobasidium sp. 414]